MVCDLHTFLDSTRERFAERFCIWVHQGRGSVVLVLSGSGFASQDELEVEVLPSLLSSEGLGNWYRLFRKRLVESRREPSGPSAR